MPGPISIESHPVVLPVVLSEHGRSRPPVIRWIVKDHHNFKLGESAAKRVDPLAKKLVSYGMKARILCSGECNIRIDLLLVYPVLILFSAAAVYLSLRQRKVNRGRGRANDA